MIGGVAYKDSEVADRIRTAVTERTPPESLQDVAEALEAAGFSARGLGVETRKEKEKSKPASEPKKKGKSTKELKFTTDADRNHPFAHGQGWSLFTLVFLVLLLVAGRTGALVAPRVPFWCVVGRLG